MSYINNKTTTKKSPQRYHSVQSLTVIDLLKVKEEIFYFEFNCFKSFSVYLIEFICIFGDRILQNVQKDHMNGFHKILNLLPG